MKLLSYDDVRAFHRDAAEPLARREVANNLPLGILNRGAESGAGGDWFMARVAFETVESALIAR
jgi:hypothetical protein